MTRLIIQFVSISFFALYFEFLVSAFSIIVSKDIKLRVLPLIGGPPFLPVHCKVVLHDRYGFDFVPVNPTSPTTLLQLVTLKSVPGDARILPSKDVQSKDGSLPMLSRAREFCTDYSKDLHLIQNNCWAFAYEMIEYIQKEEGE